MKVYIVRDSLNESCKAYKEKEYAQKHVDILGGVGDIKCTDLIETMPTEVAVGRFHYKSHTNKTSVRKWVYPFSFKETLDIYNLFNYIHFSEDYSFEVLWYYNVTDKNELEIKEYAEKSTKNIIDNVIPIVKEKIKNLTGIKESFYCCTFKCYKPSHMRVDTTPSKSLVIDISKI